MGLIGWAFAIILGFCVLVAIGCLVGAHLRRVSRRIDGAHQFIDEMLAERDRRR